ncbi:hypothetical protein T05_69 [Trichinella murrelli]|uniref:Uncharacterized protein n=1 Tax=Trichinella murrelli TaxID=144512 RepID=A0A0V0TMS3_9BILA|nr:hypothetical protein T05_69 [Trichinella murrelli]
MVYAEMTRFSQPFLNLETEHSLQQYTYWFLKYLFVSYHLVQK